MMTPKDIDYWIQYAIFNRMLYLKLEIFWNYLMSNFVIVIGYIAGFLTTFCTLPQIITVIRNKSAANVSVLTFIFLLIGQLSWVVYGTLKSDVQIIVANTVSSILTLIMIFCTIYFNRTFTQQIIY